MYNGHIVSYAQNREDIIISAFFDENETGFYVDVGANDPVVESVTKYFYDNGWSGINVEPIPVLYDRLCESRPRDTNLCLGVGSVNGTAQLHYYPDGDGLSTISNTMSGLYKDNPSFFTSNEKVFDIEVQTLESILKKNLNNNSIQFMKIDVEGFEPEVIKGNNWDKYRPEIICIEATHMEYDWRPLLTNKGYSLKFFDGLNEYYVDLRTNRADKFDYTHKVIFKEPIVNFHLLDDFKERDRAIALLDSTNKLLKIESERSGSELKIAQSRIFTLQSDLNDILSLKKHIKRSLKHQLLEIDQKVIRFLTAENKYTPEAIKFDWKNKSSKNLLQFVNSYDKSSFHSFNKKVNQSQSLFLYTSTKIKFIKLLRKTILRSKGAI